MSLQASTTDTGRPEKIEETAPADSAQAFALATPFDIKDHTLPPPLPADIPKRSHPRDYSIEVITDWRGLAEQVREWDDLSHAALEPNVFFSSAAVLSAMRRLQPAGSPAFLIIRSTDRGRPKAPPEWCGFFPFFFHKTFRGLPVRNLRLLKHDYCFLRVPLLRAPCAEDVLRLAFDWMAQSGASLVELGDQPGDGPYAELLSSTFYNRENRGLLLDSHARAKLVCATNAEAYVRASVSAKTIKSLRRLERHLAELGELRYECVGAAGDWQSAMEEFLALEASGWKGRQRTAISSREADRLFFTEMISALAVQGHLRFGSLRLGGKAIAMTCNLLAPPAAFAFKIAYDESFQRFSPGQLVQIDNMRRVHTEPDVRWMDSCAEPGHPMIDHLWKQRRLIHTWLVPTSRGGRFVAAAIPLLQWAKRTLAPRRRNEAGARQAGSAGSIPFSDGQIKKETKP